MRDPISVFKTGSLERKGVTRNARHGSCHDSAQQHGPVFLRLGAGCELILTRSGLFPQCLSQTFRDFLKLPREFEVSAMNDFLKRRMTFESVLTQADQVHNLTFHPSHTFGMFSTYFLGQVWISANKSAVEVSNKMSHCIAVVTQKNKYGFVKGNLFPLGTPLDADLRLASGKLGPAQYCLPPITVCCWAQGGPANRAERSLPVGTVRGCYPTFSVSEDSCFLLLAVLGARDFQGRLLSLAPQESTQPCRKDFSVGLYFEK